jgi:butyryl-CoA dehydrogenase
MQSSDEEMRRWAGMLLDRLQKLGEVTGKAWSAEDPARTLANATAYLEAFGHVVLAWIWLEQGLAAGRQSRAEDRDFYDGKRQACRYFFIYELPKVDAWLDLVASLDGTTLDMQDAWF